MSTSVMTADTIIYTTVRFKVDPGLSTDQATIEINTLFDGVTLPLEDADISFRIEEPLSDEEEDYEVYPVSITLAGNSAQGATFSEIHSQWNQTLQNLDTSDTSILDVPEILEITFKKQRIIPAALETWLRTQLKAVSTQAGFDEAEERRINGPCSPNARMQRDFLLRLNREIVLGKTVHPQSVEQWFEKTYQEEKLRAHEGTEGWGGHQYEGDWSPELEILRQMGSDLFGLTSDELR